MKFLDAAWLFLQVGDNVTILLRIAIEILQIRLITTVMRAWGKYEISTYT